jgi:hypothetical protein
MTPGYITLDRLHEITRDVSGWRAAHPHLTRLDPSEPQTAEVHTVPITVQRHGTSSTGQTLVPVGHRPLGYQGSRRVPPHRLSRVGWSMLIGAGLMLMFMSMVGLGSLAVWQIVIPILFGG